MRDLVAGVRATGDIWLVGGAQIVAAFEREHLIDEYILSVMPVLLGEGIRLFQPPYPRRDLTLIASVAYPNGVVQLTYWPT
ncbi:MAG: hypothetical protein GYB64_14050 [Chloroflexi bacterium]|nr:hypothetical protein [Chloroflexota bacterium]